MRELSLHILDIIQNSVSAGATLVQTELRTEAQSGRLEITIADNGSGMTAEQLKRASDPFYTTRSNRRIGLGIPLFRQAAEMTGGSLAMQSQVGRGTVLHAVFHTDSIDCMPLGNLSETFSTLAICYPQIDFVLTCHLDADTVIMDTRRLREILGDIPLSAPEVSGFLRAYFRVELPADTFPAWNKK